MPVPEVVFILKEMLSPDVNALDVQDTKNPVDEPVQSLNSRSLFTIAGADFVTPLSVTTPVITTFTPSAVYPTKSDDVLIVISAISYHTPIVMMVTVTSPLVPVVFVVMLKELPYW